MSYNIRVMDLFTQSSCIFAAFVFLVFLVLVFPSTTLIGIAVMGSPLLIIWQAYIILRDKG